MQLIKIVAFSLALLISSRLVSQTTIKEVDRVVEYVQRNTDNFERKELPAGDKDERFLLFGFEDCKLINVIEKRQIVKKVSWLYVRDTLMYTETSWTDSTTHKKTYYEKTYHYKGRMFAWINSEIKFIDANSSAFRTLDRKLQDYSLELLEEAKE